MEQVAIVNDAQNTTDSIGSLCCPTLCSFSGPSSEHFVQSHKPILCPQHLYIRSFDPEGDLHLMLYMQTSMSIQYQESPGSLGGWACKG